MGILSIIGGFIKPVADAIDAIHTSDKERLELKNALAQAEFGFAEKILESEQKALEYEGKLAVARKDVLVAEATGHSWLQRNWRPIVMLMFGYVIAHNHIFAPMFNLTYLEVPQGLWTLMQIGLGGYVLGRSAEKLGPDVVRVIRESRSGISK